MTNFVFSRRTIQKQLDLLDGTLSSKQLDNLIGRLNHVNDQRLSAMWEAIFLAALVQETPFRHEEVLAGGTRPDFQLTFACGQAMVPVVGDITTVTDSGLKQANPVDLFIDEIFRLAKKYGLDPNHINTAVGGGQSGEWPNQRMKLDLPKGKALADLLAKEVEPFLKAMSMSEQIPRTLEYQSDGARFTIQYAPGQWASGSNHISYDVILSLTGNHVYRRLKLKAEQLRQAPDDALRLVVLCDCDCAAMNSSRLGSGYKAGKIAEEFLRRTESVDLVLLITVEKRDPLGMNFRDVELTCTLVPPPRYAWSSRLTQDRYRSLYALLSRVVDHMPKPIQDTHNAWLRAREDEFGTGKHGGYKMSKKKLTLSARAIHELLAGIRAHDDFLLLHRWHSGDGSIQSSDDFTLEPNPFAEHLKAGRLITSMKAIDGGDGDDDLIEFTFGQPDAAVSRFHRRRI